MIGCRSGSCWIQLHPCNASALEQEHHKAGSHPHWREAGTRITPLQSCTPCATELRASGVLLQGARVSVFVPAVFLETPQEMEFSLLEQCSPDQSVPQEPHKYPSTSHVRGPLPCTSSKVQPILAGPVAARAAGRAERCCAAHGAAGKRGWRGGVGGSRNLTGVVSPRAAKPSKKPWWLSTGSGFAQVQLKPCLSFAPVPAV
ncbi:uncharacterized protein LOC111934912 [Cyanistes caeruleus]|uniref:uncharacterized protein LOC111934912 n=1 Tax=Cyanistes caeruleus TaxID=156563 RepID=UPI000CDBA221|nr:uncharacterized protein LOC111934912 [Cyanistes caeruleus]